MAAVLLVEAYPGIHQILQSGLPRSKVDTLMTQLGHLAVDKQMIAGNPQFFAFSTTPVPPLTPQAAKAADFGDDETIKISSGNISIRIYIDGFGRMSFFYVEGLPEMYESLAEHLEVWPGGQNREEMLKLFPNY
jgi:hypothetical protein